MKKSEMLKVMFKCCKDHDGFVGCSFDFFNDKILTTLEKAGMLPPEIKDVDDHLLKSGFNVNKWEEE